jgi:hypothetical protein
MEIAGCSEMLVTVYQNTRRPIPENSNDYYNLRFFILFFFYYLVCEAIGTAATPGLLCQPRMIGDGDCGEIGGMKIGRGTEELGESLPQGHFVHHKYHMTRPEFEPGPPR